MCKSIRRVCGHQTHPDLDQEQCAALETFAKTHGRLWKAKLAELWVKAEAPALLHRMRNTHGPDWLRSFSLPDTVMSNPASLNLKASVFVFGSNLAGIHGAGAARYAMRNFGAQRGAGCGPTGRCYALPTKDRQINTLSLVEIEAYVEQFLSYARQNAGLTFQVTQIGCGLAGYSPAEIAPMFRKAPLNCQFDDAWRPYLGSECTYWGTVA